MMQEKTIKAVEMSAVALDDPCLKNAQDKELGYLLSLDEKKLLYYFQKEADLPTDASMGYKGWEGGSEMNFRGHFLGHFLSALSEMYVSTSRTASRPRLLEKARYIVGALASCQKAYALRDPRNSGYIGPFPVSIIPAGGENNYGNTLVPLYNLHKVLQGLIEAYKDLPSDVGVIALDVASKFGTWLARWTDGKAKSEIFGTEFGGLNEALWNLYEITQRNDHKKAASMFDEDEVMPNGQNLIRDLAEGKDVLSGRHANTTIPKITGAIRHYEILAQNEVLNEQLSQAERDDLHTYKDAAMYFWDLVTQHYSYVGGGNSQAEHFWEHQDQVGASFTTHGATEYGDNSTVETCNEFNMLKLTRELFKLTGEKKYLDYYEHVFVNVIMASQNPQTGMTTYFQPQGWGYAKVYGVPTDEFWCCQGTGIENFSKLSDSFFYADGDRIYAAIYRSSTLCDSAHNLRISLNSDFPSTEDLVINVATLDSEQSTCEAQLYLKIPSWTKTGGMRLTINGSVADPSVVSGMTKVIDGFLVLKVSEAMTIKLTLPQKVTLISAPDNAALAAIQKGGYLLAAEFPSAVDPKSYYYAGILVRMSTFDDSISPLMTIPQPLALWRKGIENNLIEVDMATERLGEGLEIGVPRYRLSNVGEDSARVTFIPYYLLFKTRYAIYLRYVQANSQAALDAASSSHYSVEGDERIVDSLTKFDNNNIEAGKNLQTGGVSSVGNMEGKEFRYAQQGGSFCWELRYDQDADVVNTLQVVYASADAGKTFEVYLNDKFFKLEAVPTETDEEFLTKKDVIDFHKFLEGNDRHNRQGEPVVRVKFFASSGPTAKVFGISIVRGL